MTIRYRMQQLIGLFGGKLHDPEWRFGMQLALRADQLSAGDAKAARDR
jgi:DNA-binding PucR family transcriptional regulator